MCDRVLAVPLVLLLVCSVAQGPLEARLTQAGVAGHVRDDMGRALPFVVVTSRTGNGFLSSYTDLQGRFDFSRRPHRRGNTLTFTSSGFAPRVIRLEGGEDSLVVTLERSAPPVVAGWSIGLVTDAHVVLRTADGSVTDSSTARAGQEYELRILARGVARCSRLGPSVQTSTGNDVVVAIAVFTRRRDCGDSIVEHEWAMPVHFASSGAGEIRVVGRYGDTVLPLVIR